MRDTRTFSNNAITFAQGIFNDIVNTISNDLDTSKVSTLVNDNVNNVGEGLRNLVGEMSIGRGGANRIRVYLNLNKKVYEGDTRLFRDYNISVRWGFNIPYSAELIDVIRTHGITWVQDVAVDGKTESRIRFATTDTSRDNFMIALGDAIAQADDTVEAQAKETATA